MRRALDDVRHALRDGWLVVHLITVAVPAWFALILSLPGATFAGPTFAYLVRVTDEHSFAMISCVVATFSAMAWSTRSPWVWLASCTSLAMWHGGFALFIFVGNPAGTGSGTYCILAAAATIKLLRPPYSHLNRHADPSR